MQIHIMISMNCYLFTKILLRTLFYSMVFSWCSTFVEHLCLAVFVRSLTSETALCSAGWFCYLQEFVDVLQTAQVWYRLMPCKHQGIRNSSCIRLRKFLCQVQRTKRTPKTVAGCQSCGRYTFLSVFGT